jgi:type IV pilus assembly protein PilV
MARHPGWRWTTRVAYSGSSLIEVLVALVVISVAVLGSAGMQMRALQLAKSSELRNQAVLLAGDLAERLEANTAASCSAVCTATDLAALDFYQWQKRVADQLPHSTWSVQQTVHGNPSTYAITLQWMDSHGDQSFGTAATDATASYMATRTVYRP